MTTSSERRARILQALEQANNHRSVWDPGIYEGDSKTLVLLGWDHSIMGKFIGKAYLFFRSPCYVRFPHGLGWNPHFTLGSWKATEGFRLPPELENAELYVIAIKNGDTTYCIICEDVRFHRDDAPGVADV